MKLLGGLEPHTNWGSVGRPANALLGFGLFVGFVDNNKSKTTAALSFRSSVVRLQAMSQFKSSCQKKAKRFKSERVKWEKK